MRLGTKWNVAVALGAAFLCIGIVGITLLLVQERRDVAQANAELGQRDAELAQVRADLQQALNRPAPRHVGLEQARQQLEEQNRALSSQIEALQEERDQLQGMVEFLQHGRLSSRGDSAAPTAGSVEPGETALALVEAALEPSAQESPAQERSGQERSGQGSPGQGSPGQEPPGQEPDANAENSALKARVSRLEAEASRLGAENQALKSGSPSLAGLGEREAELRAQIASLETREAGLRAVTENLEEDRKALAVQSNEMFPVCSGSMEPRISCLDSVLLLENFLPEDILAGTIIAFIPPPEEGEPATAAIPVLHRVVDVKLEDGIYQYWPKGDAWDEPDGYWVPETSVLGYVIELLPGTRPENAGLRDLVSRTRDSYVATRSRMVEARDRYDDAVITHCGSLEAVASCQATPEGFVHVESAYNGFTLAWSNYVRAVCQYDKAYYHGLHESEPRERVELTPYIAPADCNGAG